MEKQRETGICRFCGQINDVEFTRELFGERFANVEADYLATRSCRCPEGRAFCDQEELREQKEERRATTLAAADVVIDELFGDKAKEAGELSMHADVRHHIRDAAEMVYDGYLQKAQVTDGQGITAKIGMSSKGRLKISRSESMSVTQEVI